MAEIIIEAEDIKKIFKTSSGDVCALNGIDAQFESGLFYAIIGKTALASLHFYRYLEDLTGLRPEKFL